MSSIIVIQQANAVHLVTDGASYDMDGTLHLIGSKIRELPRSNSVFSLRGSGMFDQVLPFLAPLDSFDEVVAAIPSALRCLTSINALIYAGSHHASYHFELTIAGWSDNYGRWMAGYASTYPVADPQDPTGVSHLEGYVPFAPMCLPPVSCAPPIDIEDAVGSRLTNAEDVERMDAARDGLAIIEAQRLTPCDLSVEGDGLQYIVGGFAELTTLSASGSFRIGLVQDLTQAGEELPAICTEGGWKDARMVMKYGRLISPKSGAMSRLRRRLGDA